MKKIAIYTRVSTESQTNLNQIIKLKEFAEERRLEYDIYSDVSSSKNTRPAKNILLNKIRSGVIYDAILVWSFDRWSRSTIELLNDINELLKRGVNFISYNDGIDINESGTESIKLLSAFYAFELKSISERTKLGLERARLEGKKLGRPVGSKDRKKRNNINYLLREAKKRRDNDEINGIHRGLSYYLHKNRFIDMDEYEIIIKSDLGKRISNGLKKKQTKG